MYFFINTAENCNITHILQLFTHKRIQNAVISFISNVCTLILSQWFRIYNKTFALTLFVETSILSSRTTSHTLFALLEVTNPPQLHLFEDRSLGGLINSRDSTVLEQFEQLHMEWSTCGSWSA